MVQYSLLHHIFTVHVYFFTHLCGIFDHVWHGQWDNNAIIIIIWWLLNDTEVMKKERIIVIVLIHWLLNHHCLTLKRVHLRTEQGESTNRQPPSWFLVIKSLHEKIRNLRASRHKFVEDVMNTMKDPPLTVHPTKRENRIIDSSDSGGIIYPPEFSIEED